MYTCCAEPCRCAAVVLVHFFSLSFASWGPWPVQGGAEYRGLATRDDEHDMRGSQESLMSDHSEDDHSLLDA
jgi:hypothetical protein